MPSILSPVPDILVKGYASTEEYPFNVPVWFVPEWRTVAMIANHYSGLRTMNIGLSESSWIVLQLMLAGF